ncbi:MAG: sigma-70 family RNA polymerase sigma factor [Saprospiraceae bacterium]
MKFFNYSFANKDNEVTYTDHQSLFNGLKNEDSAAIKYLFSKVSGSIYHLGKKYLLPDEDIEELKYDCLTLIIQKIRADKYIYQGFDPATYVIEIAKNKVRMYSEKNKRNTVKLLDDSMDIAEDTDITDSSPTDILNRLLNTLTDNCKKLISLKYLEERRDKEVIELKLTQYTTVDALKNQRAQCMKKLSEMASLKFTG